jgi:hypothetical protein
MIAFYYKKQEENKRLMEDFDNDYQAAQWADPSSLKKAFNGLSSDISWKPRR